MRLDDILRLRDASIYQFPANPGQKLPCVYGDFISPATRDPKELGGCLPTVLINRLSWQYLLSDTTCADAPIEIWARQNTPYGTLVPAHLYTILRGPTGNVEGQGSITAVQFHQTGPDVADPTPYEITWRGYGSIRPDGSLINDPVSMIQEMFVSRGNWSMNDFNGASLIKAFGLAVSMAIPVHWVFQEDQQYGEILTELFENYLADTDLDSDGKLRIRYNLWPLEPIRADEVVQPYLSAAQDCVGDDPEDSVAYRLSRENIINEVTMRGRHNWATNTQAAEITYAHTPSQKAYKLRKPRNFTLRGIRQATHAYAWIALFLSPLVEKPGIVEIPLKSLAYTHLQRGAFVPLTWSAGPDPLNRGWTNRIVRVLETQTNYLDQTHTLKALDTGVDVRPPQAAPFLDQNDGLWYLRLNPGTNALEFVSTLAFPWISVGTSRHWVTRVANDGSNVWIYPTTDGVINIALDEPLLGSGTSAEVELIDWNFQRWDVAAESGVGAVVPRRRYSPAMTLITVP